MDVSNLQKNQLIDTDIVKKSCRLNEEEQILTMTPESWSREYAAQYFNVSEHFVCKACSLKSENGVFSLPNKKIGKKLSHEVVGLVQNFYQDDEYSRMMPGKRSV